MKVSDRKRIDIPGLADGVFPAQCPSRTLLDHVTSKWGVLVLLALVQSPSQALWVVLLYVAVQVVEAYVVSPLVERRTVSLEPAGVIAAQLLAAVVLGAFGVVLATPITAVALVLVRMLYLEDVLGEKDAEARSEHPPRRKVRRTAPGDAG